MYQQCSPPTEQGVEGVKHPNGLDCPVVEPDVGLPVPNVLGVGPDKETDALPEPLLVKLGVQWKKRENNLVCHGRAPRVTLECGTQERMAICFCFEDCPKLSFGEHGCGTKETCLGF